MEAMRTRTVTPVRSGGFALARVVALIGSAVAAVIVIGILLVIFDASRQNDLVTWITDAARWLTGPFHGLFHVANLSNHSFSGALQRLLTPVMRGRCAMSTSTGTIPHSSSREVTSVE